MDRLELLGHQRIGLGGVVDADRQDEHGAFGNVARAIHRVAPFTPEIGFVPALRGAGNHRQEETATTDVRADLAIVIVAAFEAVEVEPGDKTRRIQRRLQPLHRSQVFAHS